jgi:hypothetical protein
MNATLAGKDRSDTPANKEEDIGWILPQKIENCHRSLVSFIQQETNNVWLRVDEGYQQEKSENLLSHEKA